MPTSGYPGMGAIPYTSPAGETGTTFRVWAPFASSVTVAGEFNAWSFTANPLAPEGQSGYWSTDVDGAAQGQQYKIVVNPESDQLWKIDTYAKSALSDVGNGTIGPEHYYWGGDGINPISWQELVIYELHIGTFNDQVVGAPGTFDTAIVMLPYLSDLGVNAVEVMPIHEFAGDFSMGYDPSLMFAVETAYGGPDAFRRFVQAAHANQLAVILDVVYSHVGPSDDLSASLWQFDDWSENGYGGIYLYQDSRANTQQWGGMNRPDYGRSEVRQFLRDNAMYWLQEFQVDGLRLDATAYIRNVYGNNNDPANDLAGGWHLLQWINNDLRYAIGQPWKITIAEDLQGNDWITRCTGAGGAGFGSQWDDSFASIIRQAIIPSDDNSRDMNAVQTAIQSNVGGGSNTRVIYTESHDDVKQGKGRVPDDIWPGNSGSWYSRKRSTLGAAAVMTSPSLPMLLQGQEFVEYKYFDDDQTLDWGLLSTYGGIHDLYRDLIHLRRNWFNNTRGLQGFSVNVFQADQDAKVIAYHRWDQGGPGDDVVIVLNFRGAGTTSYTIGFPRPGPWHVRFNSDYSGYSPDFSNWNSYDTTAQPGDYQGMPCNGNIGIGAYSAIILSQ